MQKVDFFRVFAKISKLQPWLSPGSRHRKSSHHTFLEALNPPFPTKKDLVKNTYLQNFYSPPKSDDFQNFRFLTIFPIVKVIKISKNRKVIFRKLLPESASQGLHTISDRKMEGLSSLLQPKKLLVKNTA